MYGTIENSGEFGSSAAILEIAGARYVTDTDCTCADCGAIIPEDLAERVDGEDYCETCYDAAFHGLRVLRGGYPAG